jgi:hypothetical protein
VSAATGAKGSGKSVNLAPYFNINGIYNDATVYSTGGLDGQGNSYSAKLLGKSRVLDGMLAKFGPANEPDAVSCDGQLVSLPAGKFSGLLLLGTGVQGSQLSQTIMVNYTDGSSAQFAQSFSDWSAPQNFSGES